MFTINRLNHAVLWVRDAQRSLRFYRDVLGFEIVEAPSDQALFLRANGTLSCWCDHGKSITLGALSEAELRVPGHAAMEAPALRAILRQDPDVVLVGEYFTEEAAGLGHVVMLQLRGYVVASAIFYFGGDFRHPTQIGGI